MASSTYLVVITISVLQLLLVTNSSGVCQFQYSMQPPTSTLSGCSPYDATGSVFHVLLECTVVVGNENKLSFEIRWFRENNQGLVTDLGRATHIATTANSTHHQRSSRFMALFTRQYNTQFLGQYWCQPVINGVSAGAVPPPSTLMRSNVFTLLAPVAYSSLQICATMQTIANTTCADPLVEPTTSAPLQQSSTFMTAGGETVNTFSRPIHFTTAQVTISSEFLSLKPSQVSVNTFSVPNIFSSAARDTDYTNYATTTYQSEVTKAGVGSTVVPSPAAGVVSSTPFLAVVGGVLAGLLMVAIIVAVAVGIAVLVVRRRRAGKQDITTTGGDTNVSNYIIRSPADSAQPLYESIDDSQSSTDQSAVSSPAGVFHSPADYSEPVPLPKHCPAANSYLSPSNNLKPYSQPYPFPDHVPADYCDPVKTSVYEQPCLHTDVLKLACLNEYEAVDYSKPADGQHNSTQDNVYYSSIPSQERVTSTAAIALPHNSNKEQQLIKNLANPLYEVNQSSSSNIN